MQELEQVLAPRAAESGREIRDVALRSGSWPAGSAWRCRPGASIPPASSADRAPTTRSYSPSREVERQRIRRLCWPSPSMIERVHRGGANAALDRRPVSLVVRMPHDPCAAAPWPWPPCSSVEPSSITRISRHAAAAGVADDVADRAGFVAGGNHRPRAPPSTRPG